MNKFLKKNSSTILTVIGSIGVGITAVMSARDTVKAIHRINFERGFHYDRELETKEKVKVAIPCYIPTIITGVSTILCVCGAHKLNKNVQKSLMSAYMLLDHSYKEYRNSVKETYGEDGELSVVKNIADKKVEGMSPVEENEEIFFDFFSLGTFNSTLSRLNEAVESANEIMKTHGCVSLGTLYYLMGKDSTNDDEALGWSVGAGKLYDYDSIKLDIEEATGKDGIKYYVIDFVDSPTEDYMYV